MAKTSLNRTVLTLFIFLAAGLILSAQKKVEVFELEMPDKHITGSLYNSIKLLDVRANPTDFGKVQHGAQNKIIDVVVESPLEFQLQKSLNAMIDQSSSNGQLILLLRQLGFYELVGRAGTGIFEFSAVVFEEHQGVYKRLLIVDTVITINTFDATKKILRTGSQFINKCIASCLRVRSSSPIKLNQDQLIAIDSFEKAQIPLYTANYYKDGLYYNYLSFAMQQPNRTDFKVDFNANNKVTKLIVTNSKGKETALYNDGKIYAFVYKGKPYISGLTRAFYPLKKNRNDFYFEGKVNDAGNDDIALAWALFGIVGGIIASSQSSLYEIKLDYLFGHFKTVRKIK